MSSICFLDTFQHNVADRQNLDQIKFGKQILLKEIGILPNGISISTKQSNLPAFIG
jgi:hypothetical protein